MTEYDYSPAAYERYLANQSRVSNWVSHTTQHAHKYSNPFVPSPFQTSQPLPLNDAQSYSRPGPTRSNTLPHRDPYAKYTSRPSRPRTHSDDESPKHRSRSQSHARLSPQQKEVVYVPPLSQQPYPTNRTKSVPVVYRTYDARAGGPIYLPPPRPGQTYVVVPPPGGRVEFAQSPTSPQGYSSPLKSKQQPFFKRLLGNFISSGHATTISGKGSNGSGKKSRRRLTY